MKDRCKLVNKIDRIIKIKVRETEKKMIVAKSKNRLTKVIYYTWGWLNDVPFEIHEQQK